MQLDTRAHGYVDSDATKEDGFIIQRFTGDARSEHASDAHNAREAISARILQDINLSDEGWCGEDVGDQFSLLVYESRVAQDACARNKYQTRVGKRLNPLHTVGLM